MVRRHPAVNLMGTTDAGSMSLYLPGRPNEGYMSREGPFVSCTLVDTGMLMSFWLTTIGIGMIFSRTARACGTT
ncbi:hypothetical protein BH23ACT3_BH23ACT3_02230 [soil metagenome]